MDGSQQTPTQVNEERDYEVCISMPDSLVDENTQQTSNGERTLLEDETGAVKFDAPSQPARPSSQVSEDAGFENTKGDWHSETPLKDTSAVGTSMVAPETPTVPLNPFARSNFSVSAPLAGSQLFGQTQFSSAVKKNSPTSSRPSPNMIAKSLSLNTAGTSPLKDRTNVSSPTDIRSSSPSRMHEVPDAASRAPNLSIIEEETPPPSPTPPDTVVIPESPTGRQSKKIGSRLQEQYESLKESQRRKCVDDSMQVNETDSDSDNAPIKRVDRKKRAERRRAQGAQQMEKATYNPTILRSSDDNRPSKRRRIASEERVLESSKTTATPPIVVDSQNKSIQAELGSEAESTQDTTSNPAPSGPVGSQGNAGVIEQQPQTFEAIPATSPTRSSLPNTAPAQIPDTAPEPELPEMRIARARSKSPGSAPSSALTSSLRVAKTYRKASRRTMTTTIMTSSASELPAEESEPDLEEPASPSTSPTSPIDEDKALSKDTHVEAVAPIEETQTPLSKGRKKVSAKAITKRTEPEASFRSTRSKSKPKDVGEQPVKVPEERPRSGSSSLTSLCSIGSSSATEAAPNESRGSPEQETPPLLAADIGRSLRRRALRNGPTSVSPRAITRTKKMKRPPLPGSQSTDELYQGSPSVSVLERSIIQTKSTHGFRQNTGHIYRGQGLFTNMVFAISFQTSQPEKSGVEKMKKELESKIQHAGGAVLDNGFEELFKKSSVMGTSTAVFDNAAGPQLTDSALDTGFTALIADGCSRKAKYMQALALGLPCLAHQWITTCLAKDEVVDWEPYLLCAGASAVLGNALRSRSLISYPAETARLAQVVAQRRKLLEGQRIMVVVGSKKSLNEAKQTHMFLTQALGPIMSRVFTTVEAQKVLLESARAGEPYDWVYVDKKTGSVESVLSGYDAGRKRKKSPWVSSLLKGVQVLNDELVIQSLILGRMVEEGE